MRVLIEIDDEHVTPTTVHPSREATAPPPELLEAAAAFNATSAGPAPLQPEAALPIEELPRAAREALAVVSTDAGSAPAAPPAAEVGEEGPGASASRSRARAQPKDR